MNLLLDTCALLWLSDRRSPSALTQQVWTETIGRGGQVLVSPMSAWEVSMLQAKNRLSIEYDVQVWFEEVMAGYDLGWVELSPVILMAANRLPDLAHRDPVDRILIATARRLNLQIVTSDAQILAYCQRGYVEALAW